MWSCYFQLWICTVILMSYLLFQRKQVCIIVFSCHLLVRCFIMIGVQLQKLSSWHYERYWIANCFCSQSEFLHLFYNYNDIFLLRIELIKLWLHLWWQLENSYEVISLFITVCSNVVENMWRRMLRTSELAAAAFTNGLYSWVGQWSCWTLKLYQFNLDTYSYKLCIYYIDDWMK